MKNTPYSVLALAITASLASPVLADFGKVSEQRMMRMASLYFGLSNDIGASATTPDAYLRDKTETADSLIKHSGNLKVEFVTRDAGNKLDLMVLYPADNPTHIIGCIEGGVEDLENGKKNPSVQAINLENGSINTILRGMDRCDGIRRTAWGTVLATEETGDGQAYEIIDPLSLSEWTVNDRAAGTIIDADGNAATKIIKRDALPTMAWEGLTVLDSGVVIGGDELRPGTDVADSDGGAMFKFIPSNLHTGGRIDDLSQSPLVTGSVYALQISCRDSKRQYGQGCEVGNGAWIEVSAANARIDANQNGATGYYRPEDLHKDPNYTGEGIRFCWTNTGNEGAQNYGEILCAIDKKPNEALADELNTVVNRFIVGNPDMNSPDSFEFQPKTGIHYVIEDHKNGDIWACLPDSADRDLMSDGCIKMISVVDQSAEPTGFFFTPDGKTAYLAIQHSADAQGTEYDGYPTDDLLKITGFGNVAKPRDLDKVLDFSVGSANLEAGNVVRLNNIDYAGNPINVGIKINMDGTWELRP